MFSWYYHFVVVLHAVSEQPSCCRLAAESKPNGGSPQDIQVFHLALDLTTAMPRHAMHCVT